MKNFLPVLLFLLCVISTRAYAQVIISVKSSLDSLPLPFASVINLTRRTMSSIGQDGIATVPGYDGDTLRVSYIGFRDTTFTVKAGNSLYLLYLTLHQVTLAGVTVSSCAFRYESEVSNSHDGNHFGGVLWHKGLNTGRVAVHITTKKERSKLKELSFWLQRSFMNFKAPEYAVQCPFMISFYEYIPENQLPGELLYDKPLFYFPKKDGKQTLSLDSLNIFIPREGIFICFELIMDDRFQWSLKNGDSTVVNQGVLLDGVYSNDYRLAFFNYAKNTWMGPRSYSEGEPPKLRGTIKLSLAFRYCDE